MSRGGARFVRKSSVASVVVFIGVAGAIIFSCWSRVQNTPFTMERKLADCTNEVVRARFDAPKGKLFNLVLGVPGGMTNDEFDAEIKLTKVGTGAQTKRVTAADLRACNWLAKHGLPEAYILTWSTNGADQLRFQTQSVNAVTIRFSEMPPTNSSVWLTWIQLYRDGSN